MEHINDPIRELKARYQQEPEISVEGSEEACEYVLAKDPDIHVSSNQNSRSITILEYVFTRMSELGLVLQLG